MAWNQSNTKIIGTNQVELTGERGPVVPLNARSNDFTSLSDKKSNKPLEKRYLFKKIFSKHFYIRETEDGWRRPPYLQNKDTICCFLRAWRWEGMEACLSCRMPVCLGYTMPCYFNICLHMFSFLWFRFSTHYKHTRHTSTIWAQSSLCKAGAVIRAEPKQLHRVWRSKWEGYGNKLLGGIVG